MIRPTFAAALLGLAVLSTTTQAAAQTTVNGPYYATPSWDQTMPAATRFLVLANFNNDAVLDRETGLVWTRAADNNPYGYVEAQKQCFNSAVGGRRGWRLPTGGELMSLFDPAETTPPFLPRNHPFTNFGAVEGAYWTSTPTNYGLAFGTSYVTLTYYRGTNGKFLFEMAYDLYSTSGYGVVCVRGPS